MSSTLTISPAATPFPFALLVAAAASSTAVEFNDDVPSFELTTDESKITTEAAALEKLIPNSADTKSSTEISHLVDRLTNAAAFPDIVAALNAIDDHLAFRTYVAARKITAPDCLLWGAIKGSSKIIGVLKSGQHPHVSRWFAHLEGLRPVSDALASLAEAKSNKARSNKTSSAFALGLPDAVDGKVVTRFPPEPSGYLHIGHAKAAILNQYFAQMYHGKLIIRFDDTNPSKERTEFETTILEDLSLLGITGDVVTHTSDYFDYLYQCGVEIIRRGKAYADDTEQQQMRTERMQGIASKRRDLTVEENLLRFEEMTQGTPEGQRWCIRAKISVDDGNKALRDPVIFRVNLTPHHRTGSKWKVYPTYDFACPVIDSKEGVTHALRTNEYRDRNPQYQWMLDAIGLRKVIVWDFSRLNFIYTLLSKRKLHMFVDNKLVDGWDDPRFPTVRGIRRRGLTIEAIRQYMLAQGPSSSVVSLEWDSIWALNKKVIDPIAPRLWSIASYQRVPVDVKGISGVEVKSIPRHKKNPEAGTKETVYSSSIYVEQEDAVSFDDNEEITLMDWGNAFVRSKVVADDGSVTSLKLELHLEGDFKKTKKKVTWLAQESKEHPHAKVTLHDYDYLITKKKLEEDDDVKDYITPKTEFTVEAFADAAQMSGLRKGETIQFERKGYYILDAIPDGTRKDYKFIYIPDGRAASVASKAEQSGSNSVENKAKKSITAGTDGEKVYKSDGAAGFDIPVISKMYEVGRVYGKDAPDVKSNLTSKMYEVGSVYGS